MQEKNTSIFLACFIHYPAVLISPSTRSDALRDRDLLRMNLQRGKNMDIHLFKEILQKTLEIPLVTVGIVKLFNPRRIYSLDSSVPIFLLHTPAEHKRLC